jgi:V/A-type H+-transporting ATPase subunit A
LGDNVNMLGGESATSSDRVIWMPVLADAPWAQIQITPFSALVLAEFFRDMGYSTLVVMDDLSRWQQADHRLRRRASASASGSGNVGALLRRSGRIGCFGGLNRTGSVTILGFQSMPKEA